MEFEERLMAYVYVDGSLVKESEGVIPVLDHGVVAGDGVFEALAVYDGTPFALRRHLERLARSVSGMRMTTAPDLEVVEAAIHDVVKANQIGFGKVRVTYTAGDGPLGSDRLPSRPRLVVAAAPLAPIAPTAKVAVSLWPRNERGILAGVKTTSYAENVVGLNWAIAQGADEIIFPNTKGELCEGSGSNIFVVVDGELITPTLASGCLAGVTRDLIVEHLGGVERDLPVDVLKSGLVKEAFLSSSLREAQAITFVDDFALTAAPGPVSLEISRRFRELIKDNLNP
ncbi:MAG: aminotransferase class IV [Actinomycetota bacterium]|nr:aminotransferase class IV [Actinomycetota bacterium]